MFFGKLREHGEPPAEDRVAPSMPQRWLLLLPLCSLPILHVWVAWLSFHQICWLNIQYLLFWMRSQEHKYGTCWLSVTTSRDHRRPLPLGRQRGQWCSGVWGRGRHLWLGEEDSGLHGHATRAAPSPHRTLRATASRRCHDESKTPFQAQSRPAFTVSLCFGWF